MSDEVSMEHAAYVRCRIDDAHLFMEIATGDAPIEHVEAALADVRQALGTGDLNGPRLEHAIARTEDAIMPLLAQVPNQAHLQFMGRHMQAVRALLPDAPSEHVPAITVEHLFNQLADRAMGSVVSWRHDVPIERVALALVVLRELMHHGGFDVCEWPESF